METIKTTFMKMKKLLHFLDIVWTAPLGLIVLWGVPKLIHHFDPTATLFSIEEIQKLSTVIGEIFIINGLVWIMIKLNFPSWYSLYTKLFMNTIEAPQSKEQEGILWNKRKHLHFIYFAYFFAVILLMLVAAL